MRWLITILLLLLLGLQYRLWWGEGGYRERARLEREVAAQQLRNQELEARNRKLAEEVELLKSGIGVEERARRDLGLVGEGEQFYMLLEERERKP
jgi:cell division protein FtsB